LQKVKQSVRALIHPRPQASFGFQTRTIAAARSVKDDLIDYCTFSSFRDAG